MTYLIPSWWPWVAGLFAVVALVVGWRFVTPDHPFLSRKVRLTLWSLRVLAALFLIVCLLDWRKEVSRSESQKPLLRALIDRSASMAVKDEAGGVSRYDMARKQLDEKIHPLWGDRKRLET